MSDQDLTDGKWQSLSRENGVAEPQKEASNLLREFAQEGELRNALIFTNSSHGKEGFQQAIGTEIKIQGSLGKSPDLVDFVNTLHQLLVKPSV